MFKKWFSLMGLVLALSINVNSQESTMTLFQIGDENVAAEEFWAIYNKNNSVDQLGEKSSIKESLDLYINFKLKVKEAKEAKMDTAAAFIKELSGYRKQLAKPYLVIEELNDEMVKKVYQRMQSNVRASHILLRLDEYSLPADTLAVFQKASQIRNEILSGKLTFSEAAQQYSEDPSARPMDMGEGRPPRKGNKGDMGYFSVFDMVYPFEEAAFSLQKGELSEPVRTRFGYHLILLTDKIPAIGQAKAAHVFVQNTDPNSEVDTAKERIDELYAQLKNGKVFEDIVKYSDDRGTKEKGGELPWFAANRMVPEIIKAVSELNIGDISAPIKTNFGWHIVKFIDQRPVGEFETVRADILEKLKRDTRSQKGKQAKVAQIKKEENFKEFPQNLQEAIGLINADFYQPNFKIESLSEYSKKVFVLRDTSFSQYDFLKYFYDRKGDRPTANGSVLANKMYQESVSEFCLNFEEEHLEEKYYDFHLIMTEYREGILLFDLMDKKIWTKASTDTLGLKQYFEKHKKEYRWGKRAVVSVFHLNDKNYSDSVQDLLFLGKSDEEIIRELVNDSVIPVRIETLSLEKGDQKEYDAFKWKKDAFYPLLNEKGEVRAIVMFRDILRRDYKKLNETRGKAIADYQSQLEKDWISELKNNYKVNINKAVLKKLEERGNQ